MALKTFVIGIYCTGMRENNNTLHYLPAAGKNYF